MKIGASPASSCISKRDITEFAIADLKLFLCFEKESVSKIEKVTNNRTRERVGETESERECWVMVCVLSHDARTIEREKNGLSRPVRKRWYTFGP